MLFSCLQVIVDCDGLCAQVQHADSIDFVLNMTTIRGIIVHDEDERSLNSGHPQAGEAASLAQDNTSLNPTIAKKMFAAVSSISANLLRNVHRQRSSLVATESDGIACVLEDPLSSSDAQYWSGMEGCLAAMNVTRLSLFIDVRVRAVLELIAPINRVLALLVPALLVVLMQTDSHGAFDTDVVAACSMLKVRCSDCGCVANHDA